MSVRVSSLITVEIAGEGAVLSKVVNGDIYIYPEGFGVGPCIVMSPEDWTRIKYDVRLAMASAQPGD